MREELTTCFLTDPTYALAVDVMAINLKETQFVTLFGVRTSATIAVSQIAAVIFNPDIECPMLEVWVNGLSGNQQPFRVGRDQAAHAIAALRGAGVVLPAALLHQEEGYVKGDTLGSTKVLSSFTTSLGG